MFSRFRAILGNPTYQAYSKIAIAGFFVGRTYEYQVETKQTYKWFGYRMEKLYKDIKLKDAKIKELEDNNAY